MLSPNSQYAETFMRVIRLTLIFFLYSVFTLYGQTFITKGDTRNQGTFESNAPLENIVGVSDNLEATVNLNPGDLSGASGIVKVDLRELKTGIGLRDKHLRGEMWLNTDEYPYATFKLKKISGAESLTEGNPVKVTFQGIFSVHGVSKEISAEGELTYIKESEKTRASIKGNLLKVQADFQIKLSDYGISIPDIVVDKVDDNIKVSAKFIATDSPE